MTIINFTTLFGGVDSLHNINYSTPVRFKGSESKVDSFNYKPEGYGDAFIYNPMGVELKDPAKIQKYAEDNPNIVALFKKYGIKKIHVNKKNMEALQKLYKGHMKETRVLVANIYDKLPIELKQGIKGSDLQDAAMLHDYGKVLIPYNIYNKNGSLTPEEKEIMNLHSELGYELLKQQGVRDSVCKLVKYHHQNPKETGYPNINDDFEYGIASQIIAIADKYSALTEKRCYRENAYEPSDALKEIQKDVKSGLISQEVFDALKAVVNQQESRKEHSLHLDPI